MAHIVPNVASLSPKWLELAPTSSKWLQRAAPDSISPEQLKMPMASNRRPGPNQPQIVPAGLKYGPSWNCLQAAQNGFNQPTMASNGLVHLGFHMLPLLSFSFPMQLRQTSGTS